MFTVYCLTDHCGLISSKDDDDDKCDSDAVRVRFCTIPGSDTAELSRSIWLNEIVSKRT